MNYKNKKLKFNFDLLKQLLYNLAIAGCTAIITAFLVVHFSNSAISVVLSESMSPEINKHDVLVVKKQKEYFVGDVIQFEDDVTRLNITHRVIGIKKEDGEDVYICKGDNEISIAEPGEKVSNWQKENEILKKYSLKEIGLRFGGVVQIVEFSKVKGKVVEKLTIFSAVRGLVFKYL